MAQRPTYAGTSAHGYPELASRFQNTDDDQNSTNVIATNGIANRLGEDDQPPQNIPTDARGDVNLVNRLNQWPRENRPFWLLNADHIEKHRHPDGNTQQSNTQAQTQQGVQNQQGVQVAANGGQTGQTGQTGQIQSRLGDTVDSETKTIKPQSQRGFFTGVRS